jgi:hypothetical protein
MKIEMVVSMFRIELEITIEYYAERERQERDKKRDERDKRRERQEEDRRMKILAKERTDIGLLCVVSFSGPCQESQVAGRRVGKYGDMFLMISRGKHLQRSHEL